MFVYEKIDVNEWKGTYPYIIYQRVNLVAIKNPFFFLIETGYWYLLRHIRAKWAEIDAAGATFAPEISIEVIGSARHRVFQNNPIPLRHLTTPTSRGVQITGAGDMTSINPWRTIAFDDVRMHQDNITFLVSGQNATPFPAFVDLIVVGYMIPDNRFLQWKGTNDE